MRLRHALFAAALAALALPSPALAHEGGEESVCQWALLPVLTSDPPLEYLAGESSTWTFPLTDYYDTVNDTTVDAFDPLKVWSWRVLQDAGVWKIHMDLDAYSRDWGFGAVSGAISGGAIWTVSRVQACEAPLEDIEADVRQEFRASASLNADEVCEVMGRLQFWAGIPSTVNPPSIVHSDAAGGVSIDDDHSSSSSTVQVQAFGITLTLKASTGGSETQIVKDFDIGKGGKTPLQLHTATDCAFKLDLDMLDVAVGDIDNIYWHAIVDATCDGMCGRTMRVLNHNTFPAP